MKSIAIVTNVRGTPLGNFLKENLASVFADHAEIHNFYISELEKDESINDDVVLVMTKTKAIEIKDHVHDGRRIVVVQRTIRESEIKKLRAIPAGSRVLVVNDSPETTLETIELFYHLEIDYLNLVPFEQGKDYPDISIAITPAERRFVPRSIGTVIDIGHRCIDISTFIRIINILRISDADVSWRLLKYLDGTVSLDVGVKAQYRELVIKNSELDAIVNLSHEGILLLGEDGRINLCNASLKRMLNLGEELSGEKAIDVLPRSIMEVLWRDQIEDEVVEHKGRYLVINRRDLSQLGERTGTYYSLQEVTYIKQLEQNLSKKLQGKGQLARYEFSNILTQSPQMQKCLELAKGIARSDMTVLITGESGTGKELLAQAVHIASERRIRPFVAFNCAAFPESLMESELFGYEEGAFTGASKGGKAGLFEQANNGTVFLDEIGDMPLILQVKLLRVLQERQVMRVGSQGVTNINIRVVAATNCDLREKIRSGQFREDLYYRLNVLPLKIPPLRERTGDVLFLLQSFIDGDRKDRLVLSAEVKDILTRYSWPGNIRELANVASYVSFMAKKTVEVEHLPFYLIEGQDNFDAEHKGLRNRCECGDALRVLESLSEFALANRSVGRNSLKDSLKRKNVDLPEGEIRRLLVVLGDYGFVVSSRGRRGSEITSKGKAFLRWSQNGKT